MYRVAIEFEDCRQDRPDLQIRWCQSEEEIRSLESVTRFDQRWTSGNIQGCLAELDGRVVGGVWYAEGHFDESDLGLRIDLNPAQVWIFSAYVEKNVRGTGIYSQLLDSMTRHLSTTDCQSALVAVNPFNRVSKKVHEKYADRKLGSVVATRLLRLGVCFAFGETKVDRAFSPDCNRQPIHVRFEPRSD